MSTPPVCELKIEKLFKQNQILEVSFQLQIKSKSIRKKYKYVSQYLVKSDSGTWIKAGSYDKNSWNLVERSFILPLLTPQFV